MAIEFLVVTPNNAQCSYHEVKKAELIPAEDGTAQINVVVQSWPNESVKVLGVPPSWSWTLPTTGYPGAPLISHLGDIQSALVSISGTPFTGGLILVGLTPLNQAKARKWAQVKAEYDTRNYAPLTVPGIGTFDADEQSQVSIKDVVLAANNLSDDSLDIEIPFTLYDNSIFLITTLGQAKSMGYALMGRQLALRARRNGMREEIEEAETQQELDAIIWDTL